MRKRFFAIALAVALAACGDRPETSRPVSAPAVEQQALDAVVIPLRARTTAEWPLSSRNGNEYVIRVSAPDGPPPSGGFPVIYVLDGDAWFGAAVEIARMREYSKLSPAVIVGIAYPDRKFFDAKRRSFDFTPPGSRDEEMEEAGFELGGAADFLAFLNGTLKPELRSRYALSEAREALFGHSLGGLFVLYALYEGPDSFETFLAASPSMGFSDGIALQGERAFAANPERTQPRLLVTAGEFETPKVSPALKEDYRRWFTAHPELLEGESVEAALEALFAPREGAEYRSLAGDACALVGRLVASGVNARFVLFEGEEHTSAAVSALNRGIPFALRPAPQTAPGGDCPDYRSSQ